MPTQIISVGDCSLYCSSMIIITRETPKKKNGFPSSLDSALEWQYSCGVVLYGYGGNNNNNNGKLRRFEGLERERDERQVWNLSGADLMDEGNLFVRKRWRWWWWWWWQFAQHTRNLPLYSFFNFYILCCILVPSVSFVFFSFGSETNIMYELATGSGWRKNDSHFFFVLFYF